MSMPAFPPPEDIMSYDKAVCAIMASIAAEEMALSQVIRAESDKIQYFLKNTKDPQLILEVNNSAANLLEKITDMQIVLKNKLARVAPRPGVLPVPPQPGPGPSPCPQRCTSIFTPRANQKWYRGNLALEETTHCNNGVHITNKCGTPLVFLPRGETYKISMKLELSGQCSSPVEIETLFKSGNDVVRSHKISTKAIDGHVTIEHNLSHTTTAANITSNTMAVILHNPYSVLVIGGSLAVEKVVTN